jgi:DNA repair protein SbcC/Rad50
MRPLRLEIRNFLAYANPAPLAFDGLSIACLSGHNGAGKSSLLDAITWALWGKARADSESLLRMGAAEMMVVLDFSQEGQSYRVRRAFVKKGRRSELALLGWNGQTWAGISEGSIRETDKQISDILRLDYETFLNSAYMKQGNADAFTARTPGKRKELLAEILGLDQWAVYEGRAKARLAAIEGELSAIQYQVEEARREEQRAPQLAEEVNTARTQRDLAIEAARQAEQAFAEVADAPARWQAAQRRQHDLEQRAAQILATGQRLEARWARLEADWQKQQSILGQADSIMAGHAQLGQAQEADAAYQAMASQYQGLAKQLALAEQAFANAGQTLERTAKDTQKRIQAAQKEQANLPAWQAEIVSLAQTLDALETRRAEQIIFTQRLAQCQTDFRS